MGPRNRTARRAAALVAAMAALTSLTAAPVHAATPTPFFGEGVAINPFGYVLGSFTVDGGYTLAGVWNPAGKLTYLPYEPGGLGDRPGGINALGVVAGTVQDGDGTSHPVLWSRSGVITKLADGGFGEAEGVNDFGMAVGDSGSPGKLELPVRWDADGKAASLPVPANAVYGTAQAVNDLGTILGNVYTKTGDVPLLWYPDGRTVDLAVPAGARSTQALDFNVLGTSVGYTMDQQFNIYPTRWSPDGRVTLLGTGQGEAFGINDLGVAVGETNANGSLFAVRWSPDGQPTLLNNLPGALSSSAVAINDAGYIVGSTETADYKDDAVEWTPDGRVIDLTALN